MKKKCVNIKSLGYTGGRRKMKEREAIDTRFSQPLEIEIRIEGSEKK